ncbi:hypothetical protein D3C78_1860470 [compost metagenome]
MADRLMDAVFRRSQPRADLGLADGVACIFYGDSYVYDDARAPKPRDGWRAETVGGCRIIRAASDLDDEHCAAIHSDHSG